MKILGMFNKGLLGMISAGIMFAGLTSAQAATNDPFIFCSQSCNESCNDPNNKMAAKLKTQCEKLCPENIRRQVGSLQMSRRGDQMGKDYRLSRDQKLKEEMMKQNAPIYKCFAAPSIEDAPEPQERISINPAEMQASINKIQEGLNELSQMVSGT